MIPYGRQDVTQADIDAVVEVLRSDFLTQGSAVPRFEAAIADKVTARYAVAVNSATSALHVACLALGLGPGDVLWTVPNTFVASANCARYCGADVDFVDIDPDTWNLSVQGLADKLVRARQDDKLPKIVVPVHFGGQPTDQDAIWELGREYGFKILEDASHSIGASRLGEPVGSCRWSDIVVFSFHPVKIVTTGEGGIAVTNDASLAERMSMLRSHGITRDRAKFRYASSQPDSTGCSSDSYGTWSYEQQALGFNYRMTDLQAALGSSQLQRLETYVQRRNELAGRYQLAFQGLPIRLPTIRPGNRSAFHLYVVRVSGSPPGSRSRVFTELRGKGIGVNVHYTPVHLQPYYRERGFGEGAFPESEAYGREAITIPLYPRLTDELQDQVIDALRAAIGC